MTDSPADEETLAGRRSRRSTAGNRMEAAMAAMANELHAPDPEDDIDFFIEIFEEDISASDFESTDEEAEARELEQAEEDSLQADRQVTKSARERVAKAIGATRTRKKAVSFRGDSKASTSTHVSAPARRKITPAEDEGQFIKRQSQRRTTVLNTNASAQRVKEIEKKRNSRAPRKVKAERQLTQEELLAQALANEESNLIEHRDYLKLEEEKRKKTRPVKHGIEGPLLRFISRKEETKVLVKHPPQLQSPRFNGLSGSLSSASSEGPVYKPYFASPSPSGSYNSQLQRVLHAARVAPPEEKTIGLEKSYVVHELGQEEDTPNPTWGETMTVMFGGYNQTSLRETRPPSHGQPICPLTGLPAPYRDPRSGVPYANKWAYNQLTKLLQHEHEWNPDLGCYVWRDSLEQGSDPTGQQSL